MKNQNQKDQLSLDFDYAALKLAMKREAFEENGLRFFKIFDF